MQNRMTEDEKQKLQEMIKKEKVERRSRVKKLDLPLFAFIISILPLAILLCAFIPYFGVFFLLSAAVLPYAAPSLGAVGIILAVISMAKHERGGRNLAIAAIVFGVLDILSVAWWLARGTP